MSEAGVGEKRQLESTGGAGDAADAKKPRTDGATPAAKPALTKEALEKAKAALQKQKEMLEKLKNNPKVP